MLNPAADPGAAQEGQEVLRAGADDVDAEIAAIDALGADARDLARTVLGNEMAMP